MTTDSRTAAAEAEDAAVHNMRAGNHDLAQTWALLSIMHRLSAQDHHITFEMPHVESNTVADPYFSLLRPRATVPTEPGVYQDREGIPWYRTKVNSDRPWMDLTHGHSEDRWFTDSYAAQYAPFTRMEAVA